MSKTPKINRVWNKQEKRIVRLLYRKGFDIDLSNLYWASYKKTGKKYRRKDSTFSYLGYRDEVYFCTWDYWGECEEYSLVDSFIEMKTWKNIPDDVLKNCDDMCKAYLCFSERTLDCLVFKVVKEKFKRNVTEF